VTPHSATGGTDSVHPLALLPQLGRDVVRLPLTDHQPRVPCDAVDQPQNARA